MTFRLPWLILAVASVVLTIAAGMMLFSSFMLYDDEGYVLLSLRNFAEHGGLYRDVYTQYGPFSYVLYYFLHALGMPLTHDAGRVLTLIAWSTTATLAAWTVWRVTRHSACMLATLSAVFVYLWIMISEPNHPGGLIALLTAVMALGGYILLAEARWRAWAILAGAGSAALVLTKINIGVFATMASLAVLMLCSSSGFVRRRAPGIIGAGLLVLPFALMRPLLGTPWVQTYALLFALAAIPVAAALARVRSKVPVESRTGPRWRNPFSSALVSGLAFGVVVLAVIFARGTSPTELLQGVLLGPLRHPTHFSLVFPWPTGALTVASVSFALFLALMAAARFGQNPRRADQLVAVLRLIVAAGLALALWQFPRISPDNLVFAYSISCLWVFLWPLAGETGSTTCARAWLGLMFLGQWLHPFPVPGSQIAWGTFLFIPLVAISAWQAVAWLMSPPIETLADGKPSPVPLPVLRSSRSLLLDLAVTVALALFAVVMGSRLAQIGARYRDSRSLELPGANAIRLPDSTTALYRLLVRNAQEHGDMLFSLPGMFSFNLWSQLPTPTLTNVTHWFSLLDEPQQQAIIASLEAHPRACIIVQPPHLEFLRQRQLTPSGPLYDYVMKEFEPAFALDGFEFRVRRGRKIAPLLTGELFQQRPGASPQASEPDSLLKFVVSLPAGESIASVELARMDDRRDVPLALNNANAHVEMTPIDLSGTARGASEVKTFPLATSGPVEIAVFFNRGKTPLSANQSFVILRDAKGGELGLVRLRP